MCIRGTPSILLGRAENNYNSSFILSSGLYSIAINENSTNFIRAVQVSEMGVGKSRAYEVLSRVPRCRQRNRSLLQRIWGRRCGFSSNPVKAELAIGAADRRRLIPLT